MGEPHSSLTSPEAGPRQPIEAGVPEQNHDRAERTSHLRDVVQEIFPPHLSLLPQVNEVYELRLAYMESLALTEDELVERGAYFAKVRGRQTNHFVMCSGEPLQVSGSSSIRVQSFFEANQFKTGYATHGLFPYRGKFHPQMIKALLNIMQLRPHEHTVLDPMMGSGTVLVEAALMGIASIGVDINPFCVLMTRAKLAGLTLAADCLREHLTTVDETFVQLASLGANTEVVEGTDRQPSFDDLLDDGSAPVHGPAVRSASGPVQVLLRLAYLDSVAYAKRRKTVPARRLFPEMLAKYSRVVESAETAIRETGSSVAPSDAKLGDARSLDLADESVQGVIFSPPYSFAIDYIKSDMPQLQYLGCDVNGLREQLVGLRGSGKDRVGAYFYDMRRVMGEVGRVLAPGGFCTIVVGSNTKQLARILRKPEDQVVGIEDRLVAFGEAAGLRLAHRLVRQITGIRNVMRNEWILILEKD